MTKQPSWISDWKWPSSRFEFLNENNQAAMLNFWMKITNQPSWISEWKWPSNHVEFLNENDQSSHDEFLNENNQAAMLNFWMEMTEQPWWISEWKWPSSHVEFLNENDQAAMFNFWMKMIKHSLTAAMLNFWMKMTTQPWWISEWKWQSSHDEFLNENDHAAMMIFWMKMTKQTCWISEWKWPSSHVPSTLLDRKHPLLWGQRPWITNLLNTLFKAFSDPRVFLTLICYCIFQIHAQTLFFTQ